MLGVCLDLCLATAVVGTLIVCKLAHWLTAIKLTFTHSLANAERNSLTHSLTHSLTRAHYQRYLSHNYVQVEHKNLSSEMISTTQPQSLDSVNARRRHPVNHNADANIKINPLQNSTMATWNHGFKYDDPRTWSTEGMRQHLRTGKMNGSFYKQVFDWDDAQLQTAIKRANRTLQRAGMSPTETFHPIRFEKGTQSWTSGARKRLTAEADLVTRSFNTDRLFCLPHERTLTWSPAWFRDDMMLTGRVPDTLYGFPSLLQKFFQFSRDQAKESLKHKTNTSTIGAASRTTQPQERADNQGSQQPNANGDTARVHRVSEHSSVDTTHGGHHGSGIQPERPKSTLENADVHVGWALHRDGNIFNLEKSFRSLRTWLKGPDSWRCNYAEIRESLRMTQDPQLQLFWFDDIAGEPWALEDDFAIAGAIERMLSRGKICFLLARDVIHVRALTVGERGECKMFFGS